jgi:AraC family transcriptional regulator
MKPTEVMTPEIRTLPEKKLIGQHIRMSLADNKTAELWRGFMPRRKEITNAVSSNLFSMQVYDSSYNFKQFDFQATFEKWATMEVPDFDAVPAGMETFTLPGGLYAVFFYKGDQSGAVAMFRFIFETWLPGSGYVLDNRPHFEILGPKYKNGDPDSEEEIWIPVKQ